MLTRRIWSQEKVDVGKERLKIQEGGEIAKGSKSLRRGRGWSPDNCRKNPTLIGVGTLSVFSWKEGRR